MDHLAFPPIGLLAARVVGLSMAIGLSGAPLVAAQTSNTTLHGIVNDTSGGVLPGVTVKLQSRATGLQRDVVTNAAGLYVFNFLPAGIYDVSAELSGFKTVRHSDIRLEIGQSVAFDLRLEVGNIEEVVSVVATTPLLDTTSPSIGSVIQSNQLKELPLAGRHWAGLMLLAPGAINTGDGTHLSTRFFGRARDDNNWTFDGVDATGVKDPRQDSAARLIISTESIAEFRVSSGNCTPPNRDRRRAGRYSSSRRPERISSTAPPTISSATTRSTRRRSAQPESCRRSASISSA